MYGRYFFLLPSGVQRQLEKQKSLRMPIYSNGNQCVSFPAGYQGNVATTTSCSVVYNIASSTTDITTSLTNTGTVIAIVVASILIGMVALMGLGYAVRHIRKLIGRKF